MSFPVDGSHPLLPAHWLVAGLGNPGPRYERTRHNVGFLVVEALRSRDPEARWRPAGSSVAAPSRQVGQEVLLLEPQTFMNRSGISVREAIEASAVPLSRLVVVHDDVDVPFGLVRLKVGGGHGGHNGLRSITDELGSTDFQRVRVGIGRPLGPTLTDHVLGAWDSAESEALPALLERAAEATLQLISDGFLLAANRWNQRPRRTLLCGQPDGHEDEEGELGSDALDNEGRKPPGGRGG